jgi:ABC-type bacteriocin/lantibiotic exporter with double-glycine peptidase domain
VKLQPGVPTALDVQDFTWLHDGHLDLFLVVSLPRGGERRFIGAVSAPVWLPGRECLPANARLEVVARTPAVLEDAPPGDIVAAIEHWFDVVGQGACEVSGQPFGAAVSLEAGARVAIEAGQSVGSRVGGVWCRWSVPPQLCGASLSDDAVQTILPVTPSLVLTATGRCELDPAGTHEVLESEGPAPVKAASRLLLAALVAMVIERHAARQASSTARWAAMDTGFRASLGDFSRLLEGRFTRGPTVTQPLPAVVRAALPIALEMLGKAPPEFRPGQDEASVDALARFAAICGLRLRRVRLEGDWQIAPTSALVAFLPSAEGGEPTPVTLTPARWGGYEMEDPDTPERLRRLTPELAAALQPVAYAFQPTLGAGKLTYREIVKFGLRHARWNIFELAVLGGLVSAIGMAVPLAYSVVAGRIIPTRDGDLLGVLVAAVLLAVLTGMVLQVSSALVTLRMEGRVGMLLHGAMIDRALRLPATALRASTPVILATQLETVEKFRRALTGFLISAAVAAMSAVMATLLLVVYVPHVGLIMLGCTLALAAAVAVVGWRQFHAIYEGERMDVVVLAFVYELIRLVPTVRAFAAERLAFVQWAQNFLAFQSRLQRSARITGSATVIEAGWELPVLALGFLLLAFELHGDGSVGVAVAFVVALGKLMAAGRELAHISLGVSKLMPMAKLARSFVDHDLDPVGALLPVSRLRGGIEFSHVSFSYGATPVLTNLSLRIAPGEHVAIVGPSGCGKSTVLRLILGLDRPRSGTIYVDGQDQALLDTRVIRRQMGAVMQASVLFPGTIFENIRAATDISLDEAWDVARLADIADDIEALPMGLHTRVTEGLGNLSGGQVQRLLLARALAGRPAVLLLDEATSALDNRSQTRIGEALAALAPTRITVAHRFATLTRCDRIFVLDRGQLVDQGRFGELASREGLFRELLLRQAGSIETVAAGEGEGR